MAGSVEDIARGRLGTRSEQAIDVTMWKRQLAGAIIAMLPADKDDAKEILNYAGQLLDVELKPVSSQQA